MAYQTCFDNPESNYKCIINHTIRERHTAASAAVPWQQTRVIARRKNIRLAYTQTHTNNNISKTPTNKNTTQTTQNNSYPDTTAHARNGSASSGATAPLYCTPNALGSTPVGEGGGGIGSGWGPRDMGHRICVVQRDTPILETKL